MDLDTKRDIEDLKRQLKAVQNEKEKIKEKLGVIEAREDDLLKRIAKLSDDEYVADMLSLVYEQRHKETGKK